MEVLNEHELKAYTGLVQPAAQSRWLTEQGIPHRRRRDGTVAVTWTQINNPVIVVSGTEPDWAHA